MKSIIVYFLLLLNALYAQKYDIGLQEDISKSELTHKLLPGSHVKIFLPNLPYLAISHAINASLIRPFENEKGYVYDVATSHKASKNNTIWEFTLKKGVVFQDGSAFNADSVLLNMEYFVKDPFTFSKLSSILKKVEKVHDYKVRFYLSEPYGVFLNDAMWLQFYTKEYLEKFGWNGKPTCPNLAEAGLYGLGPYILKEGYVEGDRRTKKVVLEVNKNYWGKEKPKVEKFTIYTDTTLQVAKELVSGTEGRLDIAPVMFADEVEVVQSKYAKLVSTNSMNNYAMHFNMVDEMKPLSSASLRFVINNAINQEFLLNLSMLGEGEASPTMVSPSFYKVKEAIASLEPFFKEHRSKNDSSTAHLKSLVKKYQEEQGLDTSKALKLTLIAQKTFDFLVKDIKFFLSQVNIDVKIITFETEADVFVELFKAYQDKSTVDWDMLLWGNYDWYKHPWTSFFVYKPNYAWSSIPPNEKLEQLTNDFLKLSIEDEEYAPFLAKFIRHVFENNYMMFLPTPNNVFAVNKEVYFTPGKSAFLSLRDVEVTSLHHSVRGSKSYPRQRLQPYKIRIVGKEEYE